MTSLTLAQKRALDLCNEELVVAAETLLNATPLRLPDRKDFSGSQLQNLLAIANETEAPAVVTNFIRYQMGRDERWHRRTDENQGEPFGDRLIHDLEQGAVKAALDKVPDLNDDLRLRQLAQMRAIRQYIGFASRHLRYLDWKLDQSQATAAQGGN